MKNSILILLISLLLSLTVQAGDRLKGISGSMGESAFTKLFSDKNKEPDPDKEAWRIREDITEEVKQDAEKDATKFKDGERHSGIKDDSAQFISEPEEPVVDIIEDVDLAVEISADMERKANMEQLKPQNSSTELLVESIVSEQQATSSVQVTKECQKEKVYTLDVENADQYERLEDFPFTYECINSLF